MMHRFERVDSIPSANSSSRCSLYSDNHPLMSPSLGTPKFDCLGLSPLESNLFDFNSYSTSQGGFQNGDLDWLDCLTPESEEKLFEPYGGFFSPSNTITIPSVWSSHDHHFFIISSIDVLDLLYTVTHVHCTIFTQIDKLIRYYHARHIVIST